MFRLCGLAIVIVLLIASCSADGPEIDREALVREVREADRAMLQAETERDLEAAMMHFAEGAVLQPPNAPPVAGLEAIRQFYARQFEIPYSGIVCESDTIIVSTCGDLAYLLGNSYYEFEAEDGTTRLPGKYISIWQRMEGKWLCTAVSWSGNQPIE